jgi:hypothetical protein
MKKKLNENTLLFVVKQAGSLFHQYYGEFRL